MQVRVLYLATLKDIAGRAAESVELPEGSTLADLFARLEERFPRLTDFRSALALALNQEYAAPDSLLHDQDEVALLPPVSGGAGGGLVSPHCHIVHEPIPTQAMVDAIKRPEDGAVAVFEGIVRDHSRGRRTLFLEYEAYEVMALNQMEALARQALERFAIRDVVLVHRLGRLQISQTSVLIVVASAHRAAAFEACRWLIDTLKHTVPIYKKEHFEDGAVWADGEPFPGDIPTAGTAEPRAASKK